MAEIGPHSAEQQGGDGETRSGQENGITYPLLFRWPFTSECREPLMSIHYSNPIIKTADTIQLQQ